MKPAKHWYKRAKVRLWEAAALVLDVEPDHPLTFQRIYSAYSERGKWEGWDRSADAWRILDVCLCEAPAGWKLKGPHDPVPLAAVARFVHERRLTTLPAELLAISGYEGRADRTHDARENDCRQWLETVLSTEKAKSKGDHLQDARRKFPGLGVRAFGRAWTEATDTLRLNGKLGEGWGGRPGPISK